MIHSRPSYEEVGILIGAAFCSWAHHLKFVYWENEEKWLTMWNHDNGWCTKPVESFWHEIQMLCFDMI